jgi:hypothetical protein
LAVLTATFLAVVFLAAAGLAFFVAVLTLLELLFCVALLPDEKMLGNPKIHMFFLLQNNIHYSGTY